MAASQGSSDMKRIRVEPISTYGEDAVGKFVENLPTRVRNGEFSLSLAKQ